MAAHPLESAFPGLLGTAYQVTSPATHDYNCIAWAAADSSRWWEPDPFNQYFWPGSVPRSAELESYLLAFATLGYEPCDSGSLDEPGFERVAIYKGRNGLPSHMTRQLPDGSWTSKLGRDVDIAHVSLDDLRGDVYGSVLCVLRRRVRP